MKPVIITVLLTASVSLWAQTPGDTTYQVELTATASPTINFFRLPRAPQIPGKTSVGYGISLRAMWHPGRLLSVGLLSGYYVIAEDEISVDRPSASLSFSAHLAAVPLQLALSMQKSGVEIGLGIGPYFVMSTIRGGTSASARGSRLEIGLTFFGSYAFSLGESIKIGPELRVLSLRYRGIVSVMPSCSFRVDVLRY